MKKVPEEVLSRLPIPLELDTKPIPLPPEALRLIKLDLEFIPVPLILSYREDVSE